MKHTARRLFFLVLAVLAIGIGPNNATAQVADTMMGPFWVIQGTTLWDLSRQVHGDARRWSEIFDANIAAGMFDSTRLRHNARGEPVVILAVGELILLNRQAAQNATTTVQAVPLAPIVPSDNLLFELKESSSYWWLLWVVLALVAIAFITRMVQSFLANPVTSGPPMREGGLNDEAAPSHFQSVASRTTGAAGASGYVAPEQIRVVNIRRGRGYGLMRVRYRGRERDEVKRLNGEPVYQATVEFPDGRQETMYCLQGCANDLTHVGTRYFEDRLFRFEEESVSIPVPQQGVVVQAGNTQVRLTDDELTVTQNGQTVTFTADGIRRHPDGGLIILANGRANLEFRDGRVQGTSRRRRSSPLPATRDLEPSSAD